MTYRDRLTEARYSYVAPLSEVIENDYNLNIPRYVDNFEKEIEIDIEKVAYELVELDKQMTETDKIIAGFCQQLNISNPF